MSARPDHAANGWPPKSNPSECPVYARNVILIAAQPETIWGYLVRATAWPDWYPGAHDVRIQHAAELGLGVQFHWTTFDIPLHSQVQDWKPYEHLAWNAKGLLRTFAYHRWTISNAPNGFTQVLTEESQRGILPKLLSPYLKWRLHRQHEQWLQNLKCLSEAFNGKPSA